MKAHFYALLALSSALTVTSTAAQAEAETWRLTAKVTRVQDGFTAPSFAQPGSIVTVDYHFDDTAQIDPTSFGVFSNAFSSIKLNGQTLSINGGYVINWDGFKALNGSLTTATADGLDFLSLNAFGVGPASPNLGHALSEIANNLNTLPDQYRLDFNSSNGHGYSVWAQPLVLTPVPEPDALALVCAGLLATGVLLVRRRAQS